MLLGIITIKQKGYAMNGVAFLYGQNLCRTLLRNFTNQRHGRNAGKHTFQALAVYVNAVWPVVFLPLGR